MFSDSVLLVESRVLNRSPLQGVDMNRDVIAPRLPGYTMSTS